LSEPSSEQLLQGQPKPQAEHLLSLPTMMSYGFGQVSEAIKNSGFNIFLLFYYNQVLHISATATSIALALALVFDALTDPIAGSLSDKMRSRWGRRHPFIVAAAIPLSITFYFLFNPPELDSELGYVFWLLTFAVLARGSLTFFQVPHLALGAELARDYHQRSTLYSFSTFFGVMGPALFIPVSYIFFFPTTEEFNPALLNEAAYSSWALFGSGLIIFAIVVCVVGTYREIPNLQELTSENQQTRFSFKQLFVEMGEALNNKSFRAIFFGMMLTTFILSVEGVFNPFMGFHFWGMTTEQLKFVPIGSFVGLFLSVIAIPFVTKRFDKKPTLIGSAFIILFNVNLPIVLALSGVSWFPAQGSTALLVVLILSASITAFFAVMVFACLNSMFADIADEHELEVGERREGVLFSARAFAVKLTASLGLIFGGILLDFIQFPRGASLGEVSSDVVWQLGFIVGPATSVFSVIGMFFYFGYAIDEKRHTEIIDELRRRKTSRAD